VTILLLSKFSDGSTTLKSSDSPKGRDHTSARSAGKRTAVVTFIHNPRQGTLTDNHTLDQSMLELFIDKSCPDPLHSALVGVPVVECGFSLYIMVIPTVGI